MIQLKILTYAILLVAGISTILSTPTMSSEPDPCFKEIYANEALFLQLYISDSCEYSGFGRRGFAIILGLLETVMDTTYQTITVPYQTSILWGEAHESHDDTDFRIIDLDQDSVPEVVTLWSWCTTGWGYVHKFAIDSLNRVALTTIATPDSLMYQVDFFGVDTTDSSVILRGIPDYGHFMTIKYDHAGDSILFELGGEPQSLK